MLKGPLENPENEEEKAKNADPNNGKDGDEQNIDDEALNVLSEEELRLHKFVGTLNRLQRERRGGSKNTSPDTSAENGNAAESLETRQQQFQERQRAAIKAKRAQDEKDNLERQKEKEKEKKKKDRKDKEKKDKRQWRKLQHALARERPEFEGRTIEGAPDAKEQLEKEYIKAQRKKDRKNAKKKKKGKGKQPELSIDELIEAGAFDRPRYGNSKRDQILQEISPPLEHVSKFDLGSTRQDSSGNIVIELKDRGEGARIGREEFTGLIQLVKDAIVKADENTHSHVDRIKGKKNPAIILDFSNTTLMNALYDNVLPALAQHSGKKGIEFVVLNLDMEPMKDTTRAKLDRHTNFHLETGDRDTVSQKLREASSPYLGPGF